MPGRRKAKPTDRSKLDATPPWEQRVREPVAPTTGPWDVQDVPGDEVVRVDLGALLVPVGEGYDLRLELDDQQRVVAATLATEAGALQLGVFAAPRVEGIWDEVRAEIAQSLNEQRRTNATEKDGPFGVELHGLLPVDGGQGVPARFVGVDGPRWFLRGLFTGSAATGAEPALEQALRDVVVVRGSDPLPVREPVALKLPPDVTLDPAT